MAVKKAQKRKGKPGPGRPEEITQDKIDALLNAIRLGSYMETAAAHAGIAKSTLYDWLRKGARKESNIYEQFSNAVEKAMADSELRDVQVVDKAAQEGAWKAAAWRLERKFPKRWGRKNIHKIEEDVPEEKEAVDSAFHEETAHSIMLEAVKRHREDNGDDQFED